MASHMTSTDSDSEANEAAIDDSLARHLESSIPQAASLAASRTEATTDGSPSRPLAPRISHQSNTATDVTIHDRGKFHLGNKFSNLTVNQRFEQPLGPSRNEVLEWLRRLDFDTVLIDNLDRWQEGTGQWLIDHSLFQKWLREGEKPLWCHGEPGAGKTMLAAVAINHIEQLQKSPSEKVGLAYLFCNHSDSTQTGIALIATIVHQLARQLVELPPELLTFYKKYQTAIIATPIKPGEYNRLLPQLMRHFHHVFLVVDALDECREDDGTNMRVAGRSLLLQTLSALQPQLRILVTSRDVCTENMGLGEAASMNSIQIAAPNEDLEGYINGRIDGDPWLRQYASNLRETIIAKSIEAAKGMFLLVQLHLDMLAKEARKRQPGRVQKALDSLPSVLDDAYKIILRNVWNQSEEDLQLAKQVFAWMVFAKNSPKLVVSIIQRALCLDQEDLTLRLSYEVSEDDLISVCHGLVMVEKESKVIRFVHYTAEVYFASPEIQLTFLPDAEEQIAKICILYLTLNNDETERASSFYRYASCYWGFHARPAELNLLENISALLTDEPKLCASFTCLVHAMGFSGLPPEFQKKQEIWTTPLHVAAFFGLTESARTLLCSGANIESQDSLGWTPLRWAAKGESRGMLKLLLDRQADLFAKNVEGSELLFGLFGSQRAQFEYGYFLVSDESQFLIGDLFTYAPGYSITKPWQDSVTPEVTQDTIMFLIDHVEDVDVRRDLDGRTMLSIAAENWQWPLVTYLLRRNADVNIVDRNGLTPLLWALQTPRHSTKIRLLSASGQSQIDIGNRSRDIRNQKIEIENMDASEEEIEPAICQLIGNYPDIANTTQRTALSLAAESRFHLVLEHLLQRGANPNTKDHNGFTPLHWASRLPRFETIMIETLECHDEATVSLGVVRSVDVPLTCTENLIGKPIERGVRLLLKYGANLHDCTVSGDTASSLAKFDGLNIISTFLQQAAHTETNPRPQSPDFMLPHSREEQQKEFVFLLQAMLDLRGTFLVEDVAIYGRARLQIYSTVQIKNIVVHDESDVRLYDKSSADEISTRGQARLRIYSTAQIKNIEVHVESDVRLYDKALADHISTRGQARLQIYSTAQIKNIEVHDESDVRLYDKSSADEISTRGQARLQIFSTAQIKNIEVYDESDVCLYDKASADNISTRGRSSLSLRSGCHITWIGLFDSSTVQVEGEAQIEKIAAAGWSRLVCLSSARVDLVDVCDRSTLRLKGKATVKRLFVRGCSFLVLEQAARIESVRFLDQAGGFINYTSSYFGMTRTSGNSRLLVQANGNTVEDTESSNESQLIILGSKGVKNVRVVDQAQVAVIDSITSNPFGDDEANLEAWSGILSYLEKPMEERTDQEEAVGVSEERPIQNADADEQ